MYSIGTPALWVGFLIFVLAMLALDLGVFNRKAHVVSLKEAAFWSIVWVTLSVLFGLGIWWYFGANPPIGPDGQPVPGQRIALEFFTGYLIEKALSVDNIFVFIVLFQYFAVPDRFQHRVLFYGILGALVMRALFIFLGAAIIQRFDWVLYVFGAFLVYTGVKLMRHSDDDQVDPEANPLFRLLKRVVPVKAEFGEGGHFFIKENGKRFATPLFLVLISVELTDLVFAVDSIPAIFAITQDPFIVFTSNIFAILGLRALFFLLAGVMRKFAYLKVGLALVLVFVGIKMLIHHTPFAIPIGLSLAVVVLLLGGSIVYSLWRAKKEDIHLKPTTEADAPEEMKPSHPPDPSEKVDKSK